MKLDILPPQSLPRHALSLKDFVYVTYEKQSAYNSRASVNIVTIVEGIYVMANILVD